MLHRFSKRCKQVAGLLSGTKVSDAQIKQKRVAREQSGISRVGKEECNRRPYFCTQAAAPNKLALDFTS